MVYFKTVGLIASSLLLVSGFWLLFMPEAYRKLTAQALPEKRPPLYVPLSVVITFLALFTWHLLGRHRTGIGLAVTLLFSLALLKSYYVIFRYNKFRTFLFQAFLSKENSFLRGLSAVYFILGVIFLIMTTSAV